MITLNDFISILAEDSLSFIGDGVYAAHDGTQVWLYTHNGDIVTNAIALEPSVLEEFGNYVDTLKRNPLTASLTRR